MKKTTHFDTHGDKMEIYRSKTMDWIVIDCIYGDEDEESFCSILTPEQAREIAKRLNELADIF